MKVARLLMLSSFERFPELLMFSSHLVYEKAILSLFISPCHGMQLLLSLPALALAPFTQSFSPVFLLNRFVIVFRIVNAVS
jgi:hypothetical protein